MLLQHPIVILSYNRPQILERFLETLAAQSVAVDQSRIHLFQDGSTSRLSGKKGDQSLQADCVNVFRKIFPEGCVHESDVNLGIALNFDRAENFVFVEENADAAVFFEDDMLLSPYYIAALSRLIEFALSEPKVAYVAAYGDHKASLAQQEAGRTKIVPMHHKWGFALTKRQWLAQQPILQPYLDIIRKREYSSRDHAAITAYFRSLGYEAPGTSQDAAKDVVSLVLGTTKIMSYVCFGKYVGAVGTHYNQKIYDSYGFAGTTLWPDEPPHFDMPTAKVLDAWVESQRTAGRLKMAQTSNAALPEAASGKPKYEIAMTNEEIDLFLKYLSKSKAYLEYGCGGSTKYAIDHVGERIVSVDSDVAWIEKLSKDPLVATAVADGRLTFMPIDIGPVGAWGVPKDESKIKNWMYYYSKPWQAHDISYDFILVDGRFRVACALFSARCASPDAYIAMHDYSERQWYFVVEKYLEVVERAGTLVIFRPRSGVDEREWLADYTNHILDMR